VPESTARAISVRGVVFRRLTAPTPAPTANPACAIDIGGAPGQALTSSARCFDAVQPPQEGSDGSERHLRTASTTLPRRVVGQWTRG
jgi:hypothetical protein